MKNLASWYCVPPCGLVGDLVEWRITVLDREAPIVLEQSPRLLLKGEVIRVNHLPAQAMACVAIVETDRGRLPIEFRPMCEATVPVKALHEAKS